MEFWLKRPDIEQAAEWNFIVTAGSHKWGLGYINGGRRLILCQTTNGAWGAMCLNATTQIPPDEWMHIALVYKEGDKMTFYHDGEAPDTADGPPLPDVIDGPIMIAAMGGGDFFQSIIDEVALYNRVLELDEIKQHMEVGLETERAVSPSDKLASTWGRAKKLAHLGFNEYRF